MTLIVKRVLGKLAMIVPGGHSLRPWLHRLRGVRVGSNVWISQYVYIDEIHPENVEIMDDVVIGLRCSIISHFYLGRYSPEEPGRKVVIGTGAFIGPNCTILEGVTIGAGAVVAAGSVVSKNVPAGVLYGPPPSVPLARITQPLVDDGRINYRAFLFGLKKL